MMIRLGLALAAVFIAGAAAAQTGRPAPRAPAMTARLGPQAAPRVITPQIVRQPDALPPIPRLSPAERAGLVQRVMNLPGPANLGQTIHLSVEAPVAPGGGDLSFTGGSVWSRMNVALFFPHETGSGGIQIDVPDSWSGAVAYDCAITSEADFFEWQTRVGTQYFGGEVQLWDRLIFVVPNLEPGGTVYLRTKPGSFGDYSWSFRWCDVSRVLP